MDRRHWRRVEQGRGRRRRREAGRDGLQGLPPIRTYSSEEANCRPPRSQVIMTHFCMQGLVKSSSCQGSVWKRRRRHPINRHTATEATGFWGPRRSALDPLASPRCQARARLGPEGYCRCSGNGGPQTCLPMACGVAQVVAQYGPSSSAQDSRPSRGAKPRVADEVELPQARSRQAGS